MSETMGAEAASTNDTLTTLYRMFAEDGTLLYVGISANPGKRFNEHGGEQAWWESVARTTMEHFSDRAAALTAEREAIIAERPEHNVVHGRSRQRSLRSRALRLADTHPDLVARLVEAGQQVTEWTEKRNEAIRAAIAEGGTLREVGEAVGLSHQAVKFIAHGRPQKGGER